MSNKLFKKDDKTESLLKIVNITEEELEQLDYKGKQRYYNAKTKLCKIFHRSKDLKGNSVTYKKEKKDER